MSQPLQTLKQAIDACNSLAGYYIEVNPALYAELITTISAVEKDVPFFNQLNDPPVIIANLYILQDPTVQYWQCVNAITGEIIHYPACAEMVSAEVYAPTEVPPA